VKELELLHQLGTELDPPTALPPGLRSRALVTGLQEHAARGRVAIPPRRTRRLAAAGVLAAVAAATVVSLAVALPRTSATNGSIAEVHVHLAEWSVDTNPDKTVTVAFHDVFDPQKLSEILAKAGVRAKVQLVQVPDNKYGFFSIGCYKQGPQALSAIEKVISPPHDVDGAMVFTITPAAMPRGSVLSVVFFVIPSGTASNYSYQPVLQLFDGEPDPCVLPPTPKN
jgi:hypothetical protein